MPKLLATTVAENRALRQRALRSAAAEVLLEVGGDALTLAEIARRAGLARSTAYAYCNSASELIAQVLSDELVAMTSHLTDAVAHETNVHRIIEKWVHASLTYVSDGRHALVKAASKVELPGERRAELEVLHRGLLQPLVTALATAGVHHAPRVAQQVMAVVDVAVRRVESGAPAEVEAKAAIAFASTGCV